MFLSTSTLVYKEYSFSCRVTSASAAYFLVTEVWYTVDFELVYRNKWTWWHEFYIFGFWLHIECQ
uniref:Uncharacterized protein n=1 Tax=Rhizophora mucronata TaxID=61149 RepID=A0A2P2P818_RHIMU